MGTQKHCLTLEFSKLFLDMCINLQTDKQCDIKDALYDIVSIKNDLQSIIVDIQDKNVIVLSGEVTNQNIVRLGLKDEFQVKAERHKQQNNRQVVSSENIGVDSLDKLDKKAPYTGTSIEEVIEVNIKLSEIRVKSNPPNCVTSIRVYPEKGKLRLRVNCNAKDGSCNTVNKYFSVCQLQHILDFVHGDEWLPWLRSKADICTVENDDREEHRINLDDSVHNDTNVKKDDAETEPLDQILCLYKPLDEDDKLGDLNSRLGNITIKTNPPGRVKKFRTYQDRINLRLTIRFQDNKYFCKLFGAEEYENVLEFICSDQWLPWLRSKSSIFKTENICVCGANKANADTRRLSQYKKRVSVSARSGAGDEGDQGEENGSDTEEDEAASVICKDEPGNKLESFDQVLYGETLTMEVLNAYLNQLYIPTNPANSVKSLSVRPERGRLRFRISLYSGRGISKYFDMDKLQKVKDYVDGKKFLPWLKKKSDIFLSVEEADRLKSEEIKTEVGLEPDENLDGDQQQPTHDSTLDSIDDVDELPWMDTRSSGTSAEKESTQNRRSIRSSNHDRNTTAPSRHRRSSRSSNNKDIPPDVDTETLAKMTQINKQLSQIEIETDPPDYVKNLCLSSHNGRFKLKLTLKSEKAITKTFPLYELNGVMEFVRSDRWLPWLRSKSSVFPIPETDEDISLAELTHGKRRKSAFTGSYEDSIMAEDSPKRKHYKKVNDDNSTAITENNTAGKFVYEDKNEVTLDQVESHLRTLYIPTNPPNLINDFRAYPERGHGIRMRLRLVSGRIISKYFQRPYEILDFVDGDYFFPWLWSKSDVFISLEDEKNLQRVGRISEDVKKEYEPESNEDDEDDEDNSASCSTKTRSSSNKKHKTYASSSTNLKKKTYSFAKTAKQRKKLLKKAMREKFMYKRHNQLSQVVCPYCQTSHCMITGIGRHMKSRHRDEVDFKHQLAEIEKKVDEFSRSLRNDSESFHCKYCQSLFKHTEIKQHLLAAHSDCADLNETIVKMSSILETESKSGAETGEDSEFYISHRTKTARCKFCNVLVPRDKLKKHMRRCTENTEPGRAKGPQKYKKNCGRCNRTFKSPDAMAEHKVFCVVDNATFACSVCGKEFKNRSSMFVHKKWEHSTNLTVYPCEICGKKFLYPYKLSNHLRIHGDERPFVCDYCGESYRSKSNLEMHINKAHFNKYRFHCSKCGHGITKKERLKTHVCGRTRNRSNMFTKKPANPHLVPAGQLKTVASQIESVLELANKSEPGKRLAIKATLGVPLVTSSATLTTSEAAIATCISPTVTTTTMTSSSSLPSNTTAPCPLNTASTPLHITTPSLWAPSSMTTSSAWIPPSNIPMATASPWATSNLTAPFLGGEPSSVMATSSLGMQSVAAAYALGSSTMSVGEPLPPVFHLENYASGGANHNPPRGREERHMHMGGAPVGSMQTGVVNLSQRYNQLSAWHMGDHLNY